jgi:hypothetical protein
MGDGAVRICWECGDDTATYPFDGKWFDAYCVPFYIDRQTDQAGEEPATLADRDPRQPGGSYYCAYWQEPYQVLAMWSDVAGRALWLRVNWIDRGQVTTHCTAWDARRDQVMSVAA